MLKTTKTILICSTLIITMSCGKEPSSEAKLLKSMPANQKDVENLKTMMNEHPELSRASLMEIKNASLGPANLGPDFQLAVAPMAGGETKIDPELAQEAQALVDKILDGFDMEAQMNGAIKLAGIGMNMMGGMMGDMMNGLDTSKSPKDSPKSMVAPSLPPEMNKEMAIPTCQQFVDQTMSAMPKEKVKATHSMLKSTLSGCAKIQGEVFVQCIADLNKMFSIINEHATCDMKDFDQLTKISEREFNMSFDDINKSTEACMKNQFSQCGFSSEASPQ